MHMHSKKLHIQLENVADRSGCHKKKKEIMQHNLVDFFVSFGMPIRNGFKRYSDLK